MRVLVVFDNVVLDDFIRQLPVLKLPRHDEWFELLDKELVDSFLLEHPEEVFKEKLPITKLNTELDGDTDQGFELLSLFIIELV